MNGHCEQPGPAPGGGAGRSENPQGGVRGVPTVDPPEDDTANLKSLFFVVLVFVYSKGAVVRTQMPLEVARTTRMVSWG